MNCNTDCLTYETSCNAHLNVRNVIAFSHRILPTRNVIIFDNANGQRCKLKKKKLKHVITHCTSVMELLVKL